MLSDFLAVVLALALSPLALWLALVGLLVLLGSQAPRLQRRPSTAPSRPADGEPYDWKEHGL